MNDAPRILPALVVEDDVPTQRFLHAVMRRCGYDTDLAGNGREAIALLQKREYAVVILDMMMPTSGGHDVIDFLTAASSTVPVVVCSAAGPAALAELDGAVVKAVVRKPFDIDLFIATVDSLARRDGA